MESQMFKLRFQAAWLPGGMFFLHGISALPRKASALETWKVQPGRTVSDGVSNAVILAKFTYGAATSQLYMLVSFSEQPTGSSTLETTSSMLRQGVVGGDHRQRDRYLRGGPRSRLTKEGGPT